MDSKYHVGDVLKIADFKNCVFGVDEPMIRMKGMQVTIARVGYDEWMKAHFYTINEDSGEYWWDDSCLEPVETVADLPEFNAVASIDALLL